MTDNFELFKEFINDFGGLPETNEKGNLDKYYVIELMRRGKDNPDMPAANYHFKNYYIYSMHDIDKYENEIKEVCTLLRLRAYCSVNYKLMSQVALDTLAESARRVAAHDYKKFYNIFESCSGKFSDKSNRLWIIDIDDDLSKDEVYLSSLRDFLNELHPEGEKVVKVFPTKTGLHLITTPFNMLAFELGYPMKFKEEIPDIQTNHLTLLFENL